MQVASGFLILSSFQISIKFYLKLQGHYMASYTCMYCQIKSKIKLTEKEWIEIAKYISKKKNNNDNLQ